MSDFEDHRDGDAPVFANKSRNDFNSKIMITSIAVLSFVVVLVIAFHIYVRCLILRRRRAAIRNLRLSAIHTLSPDPPSSGLDPAIVTSLPLIKFKPSENNATCTVCLTALEEGIMVKLLPNCRHTFHGNCIDRWLENQSTCPICRTEAEPRLMPDQQEAPAGVSPSAPPLSACEGTSGQAGKVNGSASRLSSFRWMLSR